VPCNLPEATHERDGGYRRGRDHTDGSKEARRRRGSASRGCDDDGDDYRDLGPSKRPKQKRLWPPPFDESGALYVFDSRSGFFYEAESNFYYDPKSRYYYSIERAAYFEYSPEQEPQFRQVSLRQPQQQKQEKKEQLQCEVGKHTISSLEQASLSAAKSNEGEGGGSGKMKIAISLKTKTPLKSPMDTCTVENPSTCMTHREKQSTQIESHGNKQMQAHDADIAKWNNARSGNTTASNTTPCSLPTTDVVNDTNTLKTTKTGKPVCLLCRRKFSSIEALQKHEQSSALHRQNLARKERDADGDSNPAVGKNSGKSSMEYRDRARDRRSMYGLESSRGWTAPLPASAASKGSQGRVISSASAADIGPSLEKARSVASAEVVRPSDAFGDSNVGSQMLKKLGWKEGSSLGRKQSLEAGGTSGDHGRGSGANAQMIKEWETIESAAAAAASSSQSSRGGTCNNKNNSRAGIGNKI